ncbi:Na/Pi symporter [Falsiroseomonas selenitidurans]|uniref:Na/Pi symporter n=1 Tax=Falsiroseomonas selenitidurans TaxID=2716335 RepID=A0ABX1E0Y2_9PROT|nr:Na/Pi symporter [Falsiroseomonas selenitidurans]NKC30711.1 Na/Pi symporter [Falsiroseomonas selenitidurans]
MEVIGALLGGIGLFLLGIKGLSANLQALAGPRMRSVVARATRGKLASAATGLLLGGLTQSSNAVTFIVTAMVQARVLSLHRALPIVAFANPGTAGLVLLATVDIRLAVLWLVGLVGLTSALDLDRDGRLKPALGALLGLGLMFLGLDLMKTTALPLRDLAALGQLTGLAGLALPFLAAAGVTLLTQSSSTVAILALTLHGSGLMTLEQTALAVYGASLGSGGAVLMLSASLTGSARRLALFQALVKAAGVLLFLLLFVVEHLAGAGLVLSLTEMLAADAQHRIGLLFLLLQLATALPGLAPAAPLERLLAQLSPDSPAETAARPQYLYERALDHPPTALDLVALEQQRLAERLPALVDALRAEPELAGSRRKELLEAGAALEAAVQSFLAEVLARGGDRAQLDRAVALEAANGGLAALRETLGEFATSLEACIADAPALRAPLQALAEALHLLLGQLAELAAGGDAEDATMLRRLTDDRGEMMNRLRRRLAQQEPDLPMAARSLLFATTAQFERAVWLVRRQALLLRPEPAGG